MDLQHRITPEDPIRKLGHLDYERCAALNNEILRRGWLGSGKSPREFRTWWEVYSPSVEIEERLEPYLVRFLKRAHVQEDGGYFLFYWGSGLAHPECLFQEDHDEDDLVYLYSMPPELSGHELGIMFNQETAMASYVPQSFDILDVCEDENIWHPLEVILDAYLQAVDMGKITPVAPTTCIQESSDEDDDELEPFVPEIKYPWQIHIFTTTELDKATSAMHRLMDAVEQRIPEGQVQAKGDLAFPWPDNKALDPISTFPSGCFAYEFLKAITSRPANFHYIAPGVRLPSATEVSEFLGPKHEGSFLEWRTSRGMQPQLRPALIFPMDGEDLVGWPPHFRGIVRAGLYITMVVPTSESAFGDGCILALPFTIGANGWTRQSNGELIRERGFDGSRDHAELYQRHGIGFNHGHCVPLYKVLENWAQRVEDGDWQVGEDGVLGGPEKFKDADTEEHWQKYWIPPSW